MVSDSLRGVHQRLTLLVQHQRAHDQDRQAEQIERDDQPSEPRAGERARSRPRRRGSAFAVSIADAIQGFDRVELGIDLPELLAHALDVAVDRAVVDIDLSS
jgi:hypothetical protein